MYLGGCDCCLFWFLEIGAEGELEAHAVVVVVIGMNREAEVDIHEGSEHEDAEAEADVVIPVVRGKIKRAGVDEAAVVEDGEAQFVEQADCIFGGDVGAGLPAGRLVAVEGTYVAVAEAAQVVGTAEVEAFKEGNVASAVRVKRADAPADFQRVIVVDNREPLRRLEIEPVVVAIAHERAADDFRVEADSVSAGREQNIVDLQKFLVIVLQVIFMQVVKLV